MRYTPGKDGDELSVFVNLTEELDGSAAETQASTCNTKGGAQLVPHTGRPYPLPTVSCKVTPTGKATFNLQWDPK